MFFEFPNVEVVPRSGGRFYITMLGNGGRRCLANLIIDGVKADFAQLDFLRPPDIAAVEVYPNRFAVPDRFVQNNECGAVIVWTKWALG